VSRKLIVNDGRRLRELLLVSKIVVGRDPTCDLSEADPLLSRRHAEFSISGDDIIVRDLGSRNGIYINGARIAEGTLQSGDIVRVGHLQMQYVEDSTPLVSVPELMDDATGLVIPGPRTPKPPTPSVVAPRPAGASGAIPKPAPSSAPVSAAIRRPAPAAPDEDDADATSYVSPSAIRRPPPSRSTSQPPPSALPKPAPPNPDEVEQTRVVPAPGRTGLRPKLEPMRPAPGEHTSVQPPPMAHTAVQPPQAMHTAVQPPPAPPVEDIDEPTSVILTPRPRTRIDPPPVRDAAREARALAMALAAIGAFLGSASISQPAADAIKNLERDLVSAAPPADLVAALKGLAARLGAAANELT
jgi:hypothetical protein